MIKRELEVVIDEIKKRIFDYCKKVIDDYVIESIKEIEEDLEEMKISDRLDFTCREMEEDEYIKQYLDKMFDSYLEMTLDNLEEEGEEYDDVEYGNVHANISNKEEMIMIDYFKKRRDELKKQKENKTC